MLSRHDRIDPKFARLNPEALGASKWRTSVTV